MVKRKANVSVDDWLGERVTPSRIIPATTVAVEEELTPTNLPVPVPTTVPASAPVATNPQTNEVPAGSVRAEPVVATGGDVAVSQGEAAEWFWDLLAQAGYERW